MLQTGLQLLLMCCFCYTAGVDKCSNHCQSSGVNVRHTLDIYLFQTTIGQQMPSWETAGKKNNLNVGPPEEWLSLSPRFFLAVLTFCSARMIWKLCCGVCGWQMSIVMVVMFLVAWSPYSMVCLWASFGDPKTIPAPMAIIAPLFAKSSTFYNPCIYVIANKKWVFFLFIMLW